MSDIKIPPVTKNRMKQEQKLKKSADLLEQKTKEMSKQMYSPTLPQEIRGIQKNIKEIQKRIKDLKAAEDLIAGINR